MVRSRYQQYEHMMNGDQPKMDALTPMIGQALNVRDQLRVEMGNQMGLGADGWASQGKSYIPKTRVVTDKPRFTDDGFYVKPHDGERTLPNGQTVKLKPDDGFNIKPHDGERTLPNETETINGMNFLSDQSKPRGGRGSNNPLGMNGYGNNRVQFAANDSVPMMGLDDKVLNEVEEYPSEPSPPPMPGRPPVPEDHLDMKNYEDELDNYWKKHNDWVNTTDSIDKKKTDRINKIIDIELQDMHPDYIQGSAKVIDGPAEHRGASGWNEIVEGVVEIGSEIPVIGDIVKGVSRIIPEIPSSPFKSYVISADFNTSDGTENDVFRIEIFENGKHKTYRYNGNLVTEKE